MNPIFRPALLLALFAITGTTIVAFVHENTKVRIEANERNVILRRLHEILPEHTFDNDLLSTTVELAGHFPRSSGDPLTAYLATKESVPVGAALTVVAPDGYNGPIKLLVGIDYQGNINGVRVVSHRETPGLGDPIELKRSNWILSFNGRSIGNPPLKQWGVKRDGGHFDQFTGATITARAVVGAVRRSLIYYNANREKLFTGPPNDNR